MIASVRMEQRTYRVIIEPDGRRFHAFVPALPGCHTHGRTITEAKRHIQEAMGLYLEALAGRGEKLPSDDGFEIFQTVTVPSPRSARKKARHYA